MDWFSTALVSSDKGCALQHLGLSRPETGCVRRSHFPHPSADTSSRTLRRGGAVSPSWAADTTALTSLAGLSLQPACSQRDRLLLQLLGPGFSVPNPRPVSQELVGSTVPSGLVFHTQLDGLNANLEDIGNPWALCC